MTTHNSALLLDRPQCIELRQIKYLRCYFSGPHSWAIRLSTLQEWDRRVLQDTVVSERPLLCNSPLSVRTQGVVGEIKRTRPFNDLESTIPALDD